MLFRVNAQSEVYEQALTEVGVPYQVRGGERFFARPEVRRAMTSSPRGQARPGRRAVARTSSGPSWSRVGLTAEPPGGAAQRAQWESLLALVELAEELVAVEPAADLRRFSAELDAARRRRPPPDGRRA